MRTKICDLLDCEVPIFAFSHCRDVVAAVTKAGGSGVLGAISFPPEQLEKELNWIDAQVDGRNYGVDVLIPGKYDESVDQSNQPVWELIPDTHHQFVAELLERAGIPELPAGPRAEARDYLMAKDRNSTPLGAKKLLEVALRHEQVKMIVSALGPPPADAVREFHRRGMVVGALCGKPAHVKRHREAGVDVLIAQGTEAGGHTGTISTMVLLPQIVDLFSDAGAVLAAGGISRGRHIAAALAMGADGVWCGTIWLGTRESELLEFQREALYRTQSDDAIRSRSSTGKLVRMSKSKWSDAWDQAGEVEALGPPLQNFLYWEARTRIDRAERDDFLSMPLGQVAGTINEGTTVREVMYNFMDEYADTMARMSRLSDAGQ